MNIEQFRYGEGNFAYVVHGNREAAAIDGGDVDGISRFLRERSLTLTYVLNTHDHADHTPGNKGLLRATGAQYLTPGELTERHTLIIEGSEIDIIATPGHTMDSIVFHADGWLITGDTLFNGTVGNCYSGKYEIYFESLCRVIAYPPDTRVYAGHDLVDYALGVAEDIDPENPHIAGYRSSYDPNRVVSDLDMELKVNPFIRFDDPELDTFRRTLDQPLNTPYERWRAMMTVH
jgi:hydroxyacylglutathione hydrolase